MQFNQFLGLNEMFYEKKSTAMLVDDISKLCQKKLTETQKERNKLLMPPFHQHSNTNKSLPKENESEGSNTPKSAQWSKLKSSLSKMNKGGNVETLRLQGVLGRQHSKSWNNLENNNL